MFKYNYLVVDLQLFAANTQTTGTSTLSAEMKTYYEKELIRHAEPNLVHDQFGQKKPIPKNGGKTIEFRRYSALPTLTTALTEGVTPDGQSLTVTTVTATVKQYGGYVTLSDMLIMTAIDNNILEATTLIGQQAGRTLDTITREVLVGGTNVNYAEGQVSTRATLTKAHLLTVKAIRLAVRKLKNANAARIDSHYVAIIHPDTALDLRNDPAWENVKYRDPKDWYEGEIGMIDGVVFIESTEAKIFEGAGAVGINVYATLLLGANAYGVTEIKGGGLQHIIKQLGSGGTEDALDQRATVGWKATKVAERLMEENMIRIETGSTFS